MKAFDYVRAKSTAEATDALGKLKGAAPKGGGTDLLPFLKEGLAKPSALVDLQRAPELGSITRTAEGGFRIGAAVTLRELGEHAELLAAVPAVARSGGVAATPLVRSRATVGGNLNQRPRCWYFRHPDLSCAKSGGEGCPAQEGAHEHHAVFDNGGCCIVSPSNMAPALIAVGAEIQLESARDGRRVPASEYWTGPERDITRETVRRDDEIVTAVLIPVPAKGGSSIYHEAKQKRSYDWASASVGLAFRLDEGGKIRDARMALGHVAPTPKLRAEAAAMLNGKSPTEEVARAAAKAAVADATPLANNAYKVTLAEAVVAQAILALGKTLTEGR